MMVQHLVVNAWVVAGHYQAIVDRIHGLGGLLPWLSLTLVFLPLAVHVGFGLKMLRSRRVRISHRQASSRRRPAFPAPARVGRHSPGISRSAHPDVARLGISPDLPADAGMR